MTPIEYLDTCSRKLAIKSDYELAKRIRWSAGAICDVRKNKRAIPADVAYRVADILGLDHGVVWADIEAHQEKDPKKRAYWEEFLGRAAVFVLTVALGVIALPTPGQTAPLTLAIKGQSVLCKIIGEEKPPCVISGKSTVQR